MHKIHKLFSKSSLSVQSEGAQNNANNFLYDCDKADSEPEYMSPSKFVSNKNKTRKHSTVQRNIFSNIKGFLDHPLSASSSDSVFNSNDQYSSTEYDTESVSQDSCSVLNETSSFVRSLESPSSWQFISPGKDKKNKTSKTVSKLSKKFAILTQLSDTEEAITYCEKLFLRKHICSTVETDRKNPNEKKLRCVLASCVEIIVIFEVTFEQCRSMTKNSFYVILKLKFLSGNLKVFNTLASQIQFYFERSPFSSREMLHRRFDP